MAALPEDQPIHTSTARLFFELDAEGAVCDYRVVDGGALYLRPEEFLGRKLADVLPANATQQLQAALRDAREFGKTALATYELDMPDGPHLYSAAIGPRNDPDAPPGRLVAIVTDITQEEKNRTARDRAMERVHRFEQIVNRSPAVVFLWRIAEGWPVEFVSDNVAQFGYTPQDFTSGRVSWPGITHPDDVPRLEAEVGRYIESGRDEFSQHYRIFDADGEVVWIEDYTRAVRNDEGDLTHFEGILLDISERLSAQQEAQRYQQELREMASRIVLVEQRERRRLATALHDEIAQNLALARIRLAAARKRLPDRGEQDLDAAHELLGEAIERTRAIMSDIMPPVLDEMGLAAALEDMLERLEQMHGIECHLQDDGRAKPISADVRDMLYRAAQELAHNTVKHADARHLRLYLKRVEDQMELRVTDDGQGFDPGRRVTESSSGFGLFSVRERVIHLGGTFALWSESGHGTVVTLRAPLEHASGEAAE
jgi:PAS domain S-box-containing protein